jgi:Zn-dependent peptidase ImmA (M78 family)
MNSLGLVIETARRARGVTQEELAESVGIRQGALSRYENGLRQPDEQILTKLADALDVTADFLLGAGKVRGAAAVDAHMRRRKTAKPSDWRRLEARLNMYRLHARRVFEQIAVRAEHRIPTLDPFETDASTAARFVRMQWRMPSGPVRNLAGWIEAAGCIVIEEDFGTVRIDGLSQWVDEVPILLINQTAPTDRKRLTMAHELGHLCLHTHDIGDDVEGEATSFAAEFLMPLETIRPQLRNLTIGKLHDLKRVWGVSMQSLIERALEARLIGISDRTGFYKMLSARGWRTQEPLSEELPPETPLLLRNVSEALISQGLSRHEVAQVIGITEDSRNPFLPVTRHLKAV